MDLEKAWAASVIILRDSSTSKKTLYSSNAYLVKLLPINFGLALNFPPARNVLKNRKQSV